MRHAWIAIALTAAASGCWQSHSSGASRCGDDICSDSEQCCRTSCEGDVACRPLDLLCEPLDCPGDCRTPADCAAGQVCITADRLCGGVGTCRERPDGCTADCPGVCGCDGREYCNACEAQQSGVSVLRPGPCDGPICADGTECGVDERCCPGCFGEQICAPGGAPCPEVECPGGCRSNDDCAPADWCEPSDGVCGGLGECVPRPPACDEDCPGVCGCDGNFYCNECLAAARGASVDPDADCEGPPCGFAGTICPPETYCDLGESCGALDGQSCLERPVACDGPSEPVCGCDGRTYPRPCDAALAGVTVATPGPCAGLARSCRELQRIDPSASSGEYLLEPIPGQTVFVYCDMDTDGGGWTLVSSSARETPDDRAGPYHDELRAASPTSPQPWVWDGLRGLAAARADVRFTCRPLGQIADDVDLSFYEVPWYGEWTTGTDAESCFSEDNGAGQDRPEPARRDNLTGLEVSLGTPWSSGVFEGEDSCGDDRDFTVDLMDRGMDSDQRDGTDWGEDDGTRKCGRRSLSDGIWQIWVREP